VIVNARSGATSLKVCTIPEVGQVIRISAIERASPRPISWRRGLPPKEPPLVTDRWISRGPPGVSTTIRMRQPMAARFVFTPTSFSLTKWLPCPGFSYSTFLK